MTGLNYLVWCKCALQILAFMSLFYVPPSACQQLICENRNPEGHTPRKTEGDGGFRILVVGNYSTTGQYAPNDVYTVTIQGVKTRYSTQKFTEFLLVAESDKQLTMGQSGIMTTGVFHIVDDSQSRFSDTCPDGVTNVNMHPKTEISVLWTAPSVLVSSCVSFKATVVERPHIWYKDDGQLIKRLCPEMPKRMRGNNRPSSSRNPRIRNPQDTEGEEERKHGRNQTKNDDGGSRLAPPTENSVPQMQKPQTDNGVEPQPSVIVPSLAPSPPSNTQPKCCACDEAKYEVRFEGVWSKETHPKDFPENEWLLHFSDIIGASHSPDYNVWKEGEEASEGIRQVAEWGATRHLETELKSKSQFINTIIKAKGLWHPDERGTTSAAFRVDRLHHLMSLVSMIGPSPDWIVGITSFDLCLANCTWMEEADFDLFPYDAGTDSGISYMSPNTPTEPRHQIRLLTITDPDDPRSPFHGIGTMKPFAKVHIRRQRIYAKNCNDPIKSNVDAHEIYLIENSEDSTRPECGVTDWTPWSDCSVTCGKGLRMRKRSYLLPMKADMFRCDRQLVEKEMCLGAETFCAVDNTSAFEEFDSICAVTPWSDWTPCSVTCGKGTRSKSRRYKNHMGRKKCNLEMTQTEMCVISVECDKTGNSSIVDENCPMTPWSHWTPCSVSCGVGIRERTRFPLLTEVNEIQEKCGSINTAQRAPCTGEFGINCQINREEAQQICSLPLDTGSCRSNQTKFFYSVEKFMCVPFEWSGCKGNRNRFESAEACDEVCGFLRSMRNIHETLAPSEAPTIESNDTPPTLSTIPLETISSTAMPPPEPQTTHSDLSDVDTEDENPTDDSETVKVASLQTKSTESIAAGTDCVVSRWSSWSHCSVTCGIGIKNRSREVLIVPQNGGKKCPRLTKKKTCRNDPCH